MSENIIEQQLPQTTELRYAGFWVRSYAASIDSFIILLMIIFVGIIIAFFGNTEHIAKDASEFVSNALTSKMQGLEGMPMNNPDDMQNILSDKLKALDKAFAIYLIPIHIIFSIFYFMIPESSGMQGSIGKHMMKIKIIDLHDNRISFWRAAARNLLKILPGYYFFLASTAIGVTIPFDKRKRGIHDMICKTYVVYK